MPEINTEAQMQKGKSAIKAQTRLQTIADQLQTTPTLLDESLLNELIEFNHDILKLGDLELIEATARLLIPLVFVNYYKTAEIAQANLVAIIAHLIQNKESTTNPALARVIAKLGISAKIGRWERVEWVMEVMNMLSINATEPLITSLVANIQLRKIYSDTKGGRTMDVLAERIQYLLGLILCQINDPKKLVTLRPLIKVLPRVRLGMRNDLAQAWSTVETLDDNYLDNKFSHELRERIHGRFSNQDLDVVEGYLTFLSDGSLQEFNEALPFFILEQSDQALRQGILTGDHWSVNVQQLLLELRDQLRNVINHDPNDYAQTYHTLPTKHPSTAQAMRAFEQALNKGDALRAIRLSGPIRASLREEFFASSEPSTRSQLMMLDEDIERIVYLRLGSLFEEWKYSSADCLSHKLDVLGVLIAQLGTYGLISVTLTELFDRIGPGRARLYTSQARDLVRLFINEHHQVSYRLLAQYHDTAMMVTDNEEFQVDQFVGGLLRRSEFDLHRALQLAEILDMEMTTRLNARGDKRLFPELRFREQLIEPFYFGASACAEALPVIPDARTIYGSKCLNLAHMAALGLPVPEGFALPSSLIALSRTLDRTRFSALLRTQSKRWIAQLEQNLAQKIGQPLRFGDSRCPLLLSLRSSSAISMPGMLVTIPNIGINDEIAAALAQSTGDAWFAYDSLRLFLRDYAAGVWGMEGAYFDPIITQYKKRERVALKEHLTPETMRQIAEEYKQVIYRNGFGDALAHILRNPYEALLTAIQAVFDSWDSAAATQYREYDELSHHWNTGVIIQRMRFGNLRNYSDDRQGDSLTAVVFTRNRQTNRFDISGEYKKNAQGHDLVASFVTRDSIHSIPGQMRSNYPDLYRQVENAAFKIDTHFNAPQDIEFTSEHGNLWFLQTRNENLKRQAFPLLNRQNQVPIVRGVGVSGGGYRGMVGFISSELSELNKKVTQVNIKAGHSIVDGILLLMHSPGVDDIPTMLKQAKGWLIQLGTRTSHASLIANQHGIHAVFGVTAMEVENQHHRAVIRSSGSNQRQVIINEGDILSIEGNASGGQVYSGSLPFV
ncbi:MAG: PEP/pyruvate-binding domain-containing protein [Pseudomonadota bacterium]